jgi:hypothetical protein
MGLWLWVALKFCPEKIPRNRLGLVFVIPWKKVLLSWNSVFLGIAQRSGTEFREKMKFDRKANKDITGSAHSPFSKKSQNQWRHLGDSPSRYFQHGEHRIFESLWSPGIDTKEWIPPAYVAWRAGTITLFLLGV